MTNSTLHNFSSNQSKDLKVQLKFSSESHRKDSFKSWIFTEDKRCNATKLAEAGFYFIGSKNEADAVQCFLCGKALDGWEENDDPWSEHQKHSPNCNFAKLGKAECKLTPYEYIDIIMEIPAVWVRELYENKRTELLNKQKMLKKMCRS
ncbi:putative baculoviral inhibition of apoptosis protein repeat [Trypoxylus dichotomus]